MALFFACGPRDPAPLSVDAPQPDVAAPKSADGTNLELKVSPLVELYFYLIVVGPILYGLCWGALVLGRSIYLEVRGRW